MLIIVLVFMIFLIAFTVCSLDYAALESQKSSADSAVAQAQTIALSGLAECYQKLEEGLQGPYSYSDQTGASNSYAGWRTLGALGGTHTYVWYKTVFTTSGSGSSLVYHWTVYAYGAAPSEAGNVTGGTRGKSVVMPTGAGSVPSAANFSPNYDPVSQTNPPASTSTVGPGPGGWVIRGYQAAITASTVLPRTPMIIGDGGIEKGIGTPANGWNSTSFDPTDKSTWGGNPFPTFNSTNNESTVATSGGFAAVSGGPAAGAFQVDAGAHAADYLTNGGTITTTNPPTYAIMSAANSLGQTTAQSWFTQQSSNITTNPALTAYSAYTTSGGTTSTTDTAYSTNPNNTAIPTTAPATPNYPFPIDTSAPDPQSLETALWSAYGATDNLISTTSSKAGTWTGSGSSATWTPASGTDGTPVTIMNNPTFSSGTTYEFGTKNGVPNGSASNGTATSSSVTLNTTKPQIVFITGQCTIPAGATVNGYGILVLRDAYDPTLPMQSTQSGSNTATTQVPYTVSTSGSGADPSSSGTTWIAGGSGGGGYNPQYTQCLNVNGTLNWTGIVLVTGWSAHIAVGTSEAGGTSGKGTMRVNGSLIGEDTVQSSGEVCKAAAQLIIYAGATSNSGTANSGSGIQINWCPTLFQTASGSAGPLATYFQLGNKAIMSITAH
jgi:hypothetical protein